MLTYNASKRDDQRQAFELLRSYNPWGKPGGGAPYGGSVRRHNLMVDEIYPEKKFDRPEFPNRESMERRRSRGRSGARFRVHDPQLWSHPGTRATVDGLLRWRAPKSEQMNYRKCLDDIVNYKKQIEDEQIRNNMEFERKMGWTSENTYHFPNIIKSIHQEKPRLSYADRKDSLETVRFDGNKLEPISSNGKQRSININQKKISSSMKRSPDYTNKMPCIFHSKSTNSGELEYRKMKNDYNYNVPSGDKKKEVENDGICRCDENKRNEGSGLKSMLFGEPVRAGGTPTRQLINLTGGVELVPLMRGRGRLQGPPPSPRWRAGDQEYLKELTNQVQMERRLRQDKSLGEVEAGRQHALTWSRTWEDTPPPARTCVRRQNLARLLIHPVQKPIK